MNYPRIRRYVRWFAYAMSLMMIVSGCTGTIIRKPDLPGNQLLQRQFEVLPSGWIYEPIDEQNIWTDSDFTKGAWAIWSSFKRKDPREGSIMVEVHAFPNHQLAKRTRWPSPIVGVKRIEWSYTPPKADEFIVKCEDPLVRYCAFNMRYEEYRVILRLSIGEYMSVVDVNELLGVTDKFMQNYLANSTTSQGSQWWGATPNATEILR